MNEVIEMLTKIGTQISALNDRMAIMEQKLSVLDDAVALVNDVQKGRKKLRERVAKCRSNKAVRTKTAMVQGESKIPSLEEAQEYVRSKLGGGNDQRVREWHNEREFAGWKDKQGNPIANWRYDFSSWNKYYAVRQKSADPDRIPDARKPHIGPVHHADNWRPTRKDKIQHVLG